MLPVVFPPFACVRLAQFLLTTILLCQGGIGTPLKLGFYQSRQQQGVKPIPHMATHLRQLCSRRQTTPRITDDAIALLPFQKLTAPRFSIALLSQVQSSQIQAGWMHHPQNRLFVQKNFVCRHQPTQPRFHLCITDCRQSLGCLPYFDYIAQRAPRVQHFFQYPHAIPLRYSHPFQQRHRPFQTHPRYCNGTSHRQGSARGCQRGLQGAFSLFLQIVDHLTTDLILLCQCGRFSILTLG